MANAGRALDGIRVLDFTQVILGPSCTAVLADHGAEVIKIERPGAGDLARQFGPFRKGQSVVFASLNRNKKSVAINLKSSAGRGLIYRMLPTADVVVNNFRPGVMESLGLGYDELSSRNPGVIYACGTGFGSSGPLADRRKPGHDTVAQALTGVMVLNAAADGTPRKAPLPVADMTAGSLLAQGILMALIARQRTGAGQRVEVSLLDALMWMEAWQVAATANAAPEQRQHSQGNPLDGGVYKTADGYIMVTGLFKPNPLRDICRVLGLPDLSRDPRFDSVPHMISNREELKALLAAPLAKRPTAAWLADLEAADVLCAPVATTEEALANPQVAHNEMIVAIAGEDGDVQRHVGVPVKLGATPGSVRTAAPAIGQHTREVLKGMGLSAGEIRELEVAGAISLGPSREPERR